MTTPCSIAAEHESVVTATDLDAKGLGVPKGESKDDRRPYGIDDEKKEGHAGPVPSTMAS